MTLEDAWRPVDEVAGGAVDTFIYGVERGDGLYYPSKVGEQFKYGEHKTEFRQAAYWRTWRNMQSLTDRSLDPLTVLIDRAHEKGFKYVAGFEQFGYSRKTRASVVEFTEVFTESVDWRDGMSIHNYPGILKNCGFSVKNASIIKTNHSSPDFRVLCFIAERQ